MGAPSVVEQQKLSDLLQAAASAPLENFDAIHELLNLVIALFWLLAYASLLQKLRQEKTAIGLSFQTLFALVFTNINKLLLSVLSYAEFSTQLRSAQLISRFTTCMLSIITYAAVVRKFGISYEFDRDSFGVHPLNIFCLLRKRATKSRASFFGIRKHWITLYIYAAVFGGLLQYLRRQELPKWFGFWECTVDMVTALALLPQLHMFWTKRNRPVNALLGRFVVFMLLAKMTSLFYWLVIPHAAFTFTHFRVF